jgi:hydroxymethylglutaryl-CoA lyase
MVEIIECPRDAMQGISHFIPSEVKVKYIKQLLKVGFYGLDFGSFVSPKAIPQMADTAWVTEAISHEAGETKLLAIVANVRGALQAAEYPVIKYLGFPFSISETFQLRNTNANIDESLERVEDILEICHKANKEAVIYLSMGFGNPYGDPWSPSIACNWVSHLLNIGVKTVSVSDTVGVGVPDTIGALFAELTNSFPSIKFGAHLHTQKHNWEEKVEAAYTNGCRRFDGAILGLGGCPMAREELTGNMPTENLFYYFSSRGIATGINEQEFIKAKEIANTVFY